MAGKWDFYYFRPPRKSYSKLSQMKKTFIIALLGVFSLGLSAQDSGMGACIIVGEPTGLSAKSWLSSNDAIDAGVAWSISHNWFRIHADYLRHAFGLIPLEQGQVLVLKHTYESP